MKQARTGFERRKPAKSCETARPERGGRAIARVKRILDSGSAEGRRKPRKVVGPRRARPPRKGEQSPRANGTETGAARVLTRASLVCAGRRVVPGSTPWRGARGSERSGTSGR